MNVADEPETTLVGWQVMQLPDGDRHLVGYAIEAREGRVSSRVETFDPSRLRAVTGSGRVYRLNGHPGGNSDAEYVWRRWQRINAVSDYDDVTQQVWAAHCRLAGAGAEGVVAATVTKDSP